MQHPTRRPCLEPLKLLKDECIKSYFCKDLVVDMLEKREKWKDWLIPPTKRKKVSNENISVWATTFPNLLRLTEREKQLSPKVIVAYKRRQTIATLLNNYKILAHKVNVGEKRSYPCGKYLLCNRCGEDGIIEKTNFIKLKNGKTIKLKKMLKL